MSLDPIHILDWLKHRLLKMRYKDCYWSLHRWIGFNPKVIHE